jgi:excisionase family DNA binding protein
MAIAEHYCTLTEAAALLDVERHTVARWIRDGRFKSERVGGVVLIERGVVQAEAKRMSSRDQVHRATEPRGHEQAT